MTEASMDDLDVCASALPFRSDILAATWIFVALFGVAAGALAAGGSALAILVAALLLGVLGLLGLCAAAL
ncbi:MAG: hypothetical protein WBQ44_23270 [Rhodococcus sp. (in: high G+C Gram-positive bacteria)]